MSNEVKIIVTSDDSSDLSATERRYRTSGERSGKQWESGFTAASKNTGSKVGKEVGDDLKKSFSEANLRIGERLADSLEVGAKRGSSALADLEGSVKDLDRKIEVHRNSIRELGAEYARTGNKDVFASLRNTRGVLSNLTQVRKELTGFSTVGDEVGNKLKKSMHAAGQKGAGGLHAGLMEGRAQLIVAAVALAAVFAGALNAALLVAGGAGVIGLGALFLKEEPAVVSAAMRMAGSLKSIFSEAAQPLVGPFVEALGNIQSRMGRLGPALRETFSNAVPFVNKLVDSVFGLVEGALPGFNRMLSRSGPILDALAQGAASVGTTLSQMFDIMTSNPQQSADALTALINTVNALGIAFAWTLRIVQDAMAPVTDAVNGLKGSWGGLLEKMASGNGAIADVAKGAIRQSEALALADAAAKGMGESSATAAEHAMELSGAISGLNSQLLAMSGSAIAVEAAFDTASSAIRKNGKNLDINTAKGRNNRSAIDGIASAALKQQEAMRAAGASTSSMSSKLGRAYNQFVKAAHGAGMSRTAADKLARSYGLLPHVKKTNVSAPGASKSKSQVDALRRSLAGVHSKSVRLTISTIYKTYGKASALAAQKYNRAGLATGGVMSRAAEGGPRKNLIMVGEDGPETIDLNSGTVYPTANARMQDYARGRSGSGEPIVLELRSSGRDIDELLLRILHRAIHVRGGNVQVVLGRSY
jgi:hypothetical protein